MFVSAKEENFFLKKGLLVHHQMQTYDKRENRMYVNVI